jgi:hypothetical protein
MSSSIRTSDDFNILRLYAVFTWYLDSKTSRNLVTPLLVHKVKTAYFSETLPLDRKTQRCDPKYSNLSGTKICRHSVWMIVDYHPVAVHCTCRISLHQHSWQYLWCYVQGRLIIHMGVAVYTILHSPLHHALDS